MQARARVHDLTALAGRVAPLSMAAERLMPVAAPLAPLFPDGGLVRGQCVRCAGRVGMSAALAVVAEGTRRGHWAAIAGIAGVGVRAAAEMGVALERLVLVEGAGALEPAVLASLVDGFDLLIVGGADRIRPGIARTAQARAQARGVVTVVVGASGAFSADVELRSATAWWDGLGDGAGRLTRRRVTLHATGRRVPRPRQCEMWLPDPGGRIELSAGSDTVAAAEHDVVPALERAG